MPKRPSITRPRVRIASTCARRPRSVTGQPAAASSPPTTEPRAPAPAIRIGTRARYVAHPRATSRRGSGRFGATDAHMIDRRRLQEFFLELVRIDSPSRREGRIAARLARELTGLGAEAIFDGAGPAVGGETGNLIARVPGTVDAPPLLLCAHMDTV